MHKTARSRGRTRKNRAWVPDQHGAWAMVLLPLFFGIALSRGAWVHVPLAVAWLSGYLCFFAVGLLFKVRTARRGDRKKQFAVPTLVYGVVCVCASLMVVATNPRVIAFGLLFGPLMTVALWEAWQKRGRSLASGLSTTIASALLIAVACFLTGTLTPHIWWITGLVAFYFAGTVPVVKTMIRCRGDKRMLLFSVGYHVVGVVLAAGALLCHQVGWSPVVYTILLTIRAAAFPAINHRRAGAGQPPLSVKAIGRGESLFTLLLIPTVFTM